MKGKNMEQHGTVYVLELNPQFVRDHPDIVISWAKNPNTTQEDVSKYPQAGYWREMTADEYTEWRDENGLEETHPS